ncbi:AraC family transcriptional regulator [Marinilabiliaceae bacterium JC017]|nr:AraC family transcriptional regulator [Marinilabiliaceae bacterium JC017]
MSKNHPQITYREFQPHPELAAFIKAYWYFNIRTQCLQPFHIVPDGCFDLLIMIKNNQIVNTEITGVWSKSITVSYSNNMEVFGIRFKPMALDHLIKVSIKDYLNSDSPFDLEELNLRGQMIIDGLNSFPQMLINYLDHHFRSKLKIAKTDTRFIHLFNQIESSSGLKTVAALSNEVGLSTRQIHRKLTNLMGIGPKDYSRIIRFEQVLKTTKHNTSDFYGYFDQSHFIRDFKAFTGNTPKEVYLGKDVRFLQFYDFESM